MSVKLLRLFSVVLALVHLTTQENDYLYSFTEDEVHNILEKSCLITGSPTDQGHMLISLNHIFKEDDRVEIGFIDNLDQYLTSKENSLVVFKRVKKDRSCLLQPTKTQRKLDYEIYKGQMILEIVTSFINERCGTFRKAPDGLLTIAGLHKEDILENLFHVSDVSNVNMKVLYQGRGENPHSLGFGEHVPERSETGNESDDCSSDNHAHKKYLQSKIHQQVMAQCERLKTPPTKEEFFHEYVKRSRPFILENATNHWPAFTKWTNQYLRNQFGNKSVHIKLTPSGDYEGVEEANIWEDYATFSIPDAVKSQLKYPDLVVVRPAGVTMKFSEFIDLINTTSLLPISERNVSAYLEYTSLAEYFQILESDVVEPAFAKNLLIRQHLNIWLSDGHTLGRLHFDPYDNLLCQLAGKKEVLLFDPHDNRKLYEAHIPQAELSFDRDARKFRRKKLQDSTALVMSPVDIHKPDLKRFPKFMDAHPMNCTIGEGEMLFMPSFWWHEVKSSPSTINPRNLAVNFWYEPFLTKEFPCEDCPLEINPTYFDKL